MGLELARGHDDREARVGRIDGAAEVERAADDVDADERAAADHLEVRRERVRDGIERDLRIDRSAFDVDLVHGRPSAGVTQGFGGDDYDLTLAHNRCADGYGRLRHRYASRAVPTALADAAAALERIWRAHVRPLVPADGGLVDVHAHLGADASDGSRLDLADAARDDGRGRRRRAPGRSRSSRRPARATPPSTPRWRPRPRRAAGASWRSPQRAGRALPGRARVGPRRRRARHQAAHEPARLRLLAPAARRRLRARRRAARADPLPHRAARCRRSRATWRACSSAIPARRSCSRTARSPTCTRSARCATRTSASTRRSGTRSTCARCSPRPRPSSCCTAPTRRTTRPIGTQAKLFPQLAAAGASDAQRRDVAALERGAAARRGAMRALSEPLAADLPLPLAPAPPRARVPRDGRAADLAADARPHRAARARAPGAGRAGRTRAPRRRSSCSRWPSARGRSSWSTATAARS